jgi:hypothetical protein
MLILPGARWAGPPAIASFFQHTPVKPLLLALFLLPLCSWAQSWPVDPLSGKIIYAEEVPVKDAPKTDLYRRAQAWWQATPAKPAAFQVADFANGLLIGKNHALVKVQEGGSVRTWQLGYTLKIEMEDDRYWYSLHDLHLQQLPAPPAAAKAGPKQPLETLVLPQAAGKKGRGHTVPAPLPGKTHQAIRTLIASLKAAML